MQLTPVTNRRALTLIEVLLIMTVVAFLAALFLVREFRIDKVPRRITCMNSLKAISLSFEIWAGDNQDRYPMRVSRTNGGTQEWVVTGLAWPHFQVLSNELNTPVWLTCPADRQRVKAADWSKLSNSNVSYFLCVDAPGGGTRTLLAGDRQITRNGKLLPPGLQVLDAREKLGWFKYSHNDRLLGSGWGHITYTHEARDVRGVDARGLRDVFAGSGLATNRIVVP